MIDQLPAARALDGAPAIPGPQDVLDAWLEGRSPRTLAAYEKDLRDFSRFLKCDSPAAAVDLFLAHGPGAANRVGLGYRAHLLARQLATATIARRLAALRSMVTVARTIGRITWALDVQAPRVEPYRDTRGPGLAGWRRLLEFVKASALEGGWPARRDLAIVRMMHDLGLRRGELAALEIDDLVLDPEPGTVAILGKGKTEKVRVTLNIPTRAAIADWISCRGDDPGPLFTRLDRARETEELEGLTGQALERLVKRWAKRAGIKELVRPHGLRHQGITRALDLSGGDVRKVRRFSRHAKLETLLTYDDNRRDLGGEVARVLGEDGDQ